MKNYNLYKCKVERSRINGNYTVWLPEQENNDFVQMIVDNNSFSHGTFWERLVKVSANEFGLALDDVSITHLQFAREYQNSIEQK